MVRDAVPKRRAEFATGRACAREALGAIGIPPSPILQGDQGEPSWPTGVVGSITHCVGYRASAVARIEDLRTLGIDAEPNAPLPHGVLADIALPDERKALEEHAGQNRRVCWDRLLFCAKEAIYKAWFPVMRSWLGFHDALVDFDIHTGGFRGVLVAPEEAVDQDLRTLTGKWLVREDKLLAAVTVPGVSAEGLRA